MTQDENNKQWEVLVPHPVGTLTVLEQPRHVTPGLRKPYEYCLKISQVESLVSALRDIADEAKRRNKLQCSLVERKALSRGIRLNVFLLGHSDAITPNEWTAVTESVNEALRCLEDSKPYVERWNKSSKFQFRFEAYIMFEELRKP